MDRRFFLFQTHLIRDSALFAYGLHMISIRHRIITINKKKKHTLTNI